MDKVSDIMCALFCSCVQLAGGHALWTAPGSLSLSLSVFQLAEMQRLPIVRPRVHVAGMLPAVMKSSGNVVYYRIIAHPRSNRTGNDSNEGNEERKF